jgi:serine/threonine protein kinase
MDIGIEFSHYRVVDHIGRGGMADVWSARDTKLPRTVAIKTIARNLSQDLDPIRMFKQEAETIGQLEHPHILPLYEFGEYDNQLFIVMRYVSGGSLETLINQGPLAIDDVLRLGKAVAGALDYAHSNRVVHLDLKPSNILMDSQGSPYLADFGLASVMGPEGRAQNPGSGTLLYMAPEQLTSEVLDHRADIYSFAIVLFHMLTGALPFDATTSLALKQLQSKENLPQLEKIGPGLAPVLTPVLRRGTSLDVNDRPQRVLDLMDEFERAISGLQTPTVAAPTIDFGPAATAGLQKQLDDLATGIQQLTPEDMARREAVDIYERAHRAWSGGQGRFVLGVTDFMVISDYYANAETNKLTMDEAGKQLFLRGALEFDHEINFWWDKLDNESRRWVTLHAIRSENPQARVRALQRLETMPDSDVPQIPKLVAQALQVETNKDARLEAINVLEKRAPQSVTWRDAAYTPEIDGLLAKIALDGSDPVSAERAARVIGRIRSLAAVREVAEQQRKGAKGALRALALIRDEAPSLPNVVSPTGRFYAWLNNTWRRLSQNPMRIVWRYIFALLGGWIGMSVYVWTSLPDVAVLDPQRWGLTISIGLTYGFFIGFLVLFAAELPDRLRGFWPFWARLILGGVLGVLWGTLTWGAFTWFFLNYPPDWNVMLIGGLGAAAGFMLTSLFDLPGLLAFLVTLVCTYLPLYVAFKANQTDFNSSAIIYVRQPEQIFSQVIPVIAIVALGAHLAAVIRNTRKLVGR